MQVLCFINALFVRVIVLHDPVVHRTMGRGKKIFKLVWRCHQLLSGFLAKSKEMILHLSIVFHCFYGVVIAAHMQCDLFKIYCAAPNLGILGREDAD